MGIKIDDGSITRMLLTDKSGLDYHYKNKKPFLKRHPLLTIETKRISGRNPFIYETYPY